MRQDPKTRVELYALLLPLKDHMAKFKETGEVALSANDVQLMADTYESVQVMGMGSMPSQLQTGCAGCIRDAFHVFISVFDKLERDPHVNKTDESLDLYNQRRDQLTAIGYKYSEADKGFVGKVGFIGDEDVRNTPSEEFEAMVAVANASELSGGEDLTETEEDDLLLTLGITRDDTPQTYLAKLSEYIENQPAPSEKVLAKEGKLKEVVASLPPVVINAAPVVDPAAVVNAPEVKGAPLNTSDTLTPAQKTAATKAANKVKSDKK